MPRQSLPEAIAEQLTQRLKAGEFEVGHQLPGHRDLASAFGVSVPVVREALSRLTAQGWLEIRPGQGTFVGSLAPEREFGKAGKEIDPASDSDLLELLEARTVLEVELGALAAKRSDEQRSDTLDRLVNRMWESRRDARAFSDADLAFHIALAEAAQNTVLLRVMLDLRTSMRQFMEARRAMGSAPLEQIGAEIVLEHSAIVEAVRASDEDGARAAVSTIMARARRDLTG